MVNRMTVDELEEMVHQQGERMKNLHLGAGTRGHLEDICIKMESEDGTKFLQGVGLMELYRTKRGVCGKIHAVWVAPECRCIGYETVLLDHLELEAKLYLDAMNESLKVVIANIARTNVDQVKAFEEAGYRVTESYRGFSAGKEMGA